MRGRAARILVPALVVLGLVALVAIAATGSTTSASDADARAPGVLGGAMLGLALVALIASVAFIVFAFWHERGRDYPSTVGGFTQYVLIATLLLLLVVLNVGDWRLPGLDKLRPTRMSSTVTSTSEDASTATSDARSTWLAMLAVLVLAALGAAAFYVASRSKRKPPAEEGALVDTLDDVLAETLDDLRRERDPRRAVVAAYARLERALAANGLPRRPAETQGEHIARILHALEVDRDAVGRLVDLYAWAKFSQHEVDVGMKNEAIETLEGLRGELAAARSRSRDRQPKAVRTSDEPA